MMECNEILSYWAMWMRARARAGLCDVAPQGGACGHGGDGDGKGGEQAGHGGEGKRGHAAGHGGHGAVGRSGHGRGGCEGQVGCEPVGQTAEYLLDPEAPGEHGDDGADLVADEGSKGGAYGG